MGAGQLALEGNFGYNFLLGVLATVNPCGFILLPTYLMFFLGLEGARPGTQRASIARGLAVGAAVSAGFFVVFLVIGVLFKAGVTWFTDQASWLSLVVGVLLVVFGIAWLFGWRPSLIVPRLEVGGTERTVVSMFLYGVTYAVASIGCTLPFFTSGILSTLSNHGVASGVVAIVVYGLGMGLMLITLTVTLAFARTGLLDVLRSAMKYVEYAAPVFLILTGAYLIVYGRTGLTGSSSSTVDRVESIQTSVANWLNDFGATTLAVVLGGVTVAALVFVFVRRDRANLAQALTRAVGMFGELLAQPGVEEIVELRGSFGFMAFHGGSLEEMTDVVARRAAEQSGVSYYGVHQPVDFQWHIPSTQIAPAESPSLAAFLAHVEVVVTVHGYGRDGLFTTMLLGGRNRELASHVAGHLRENLPGYTSETDLELIPTALRGLHPANPVNLARGGGVQLELPPRVRGSSPIWRDWKGPGLVPHTESLIAAPTAAARTWPLGATPAPGPAAAHLTAHLP